MIYEVSITVPRSHQEQFTDFLSKHLEQMVLLSAIKKALAFRLHEPHQGEKIGFVVHYEMESLNAYELYLRDDAAKMRAEGEKLFGAVWNVSRRALIPML